MCACLRFQRSRRENDLGTAKAREAAMQRSVVAMMSLPLFTTALPPARTGSAGDTIEPGYIDPLAGAFARQGDASLQYFAYLIDRFYSEGGAPGKKFEIVSHDSKPRPAGELIARDSVIDQNVAFVMQCAGSNAGSALIDGASQYDSRDPDRSDT
jgi:ABC-type branched-subunit amino acid transport system substrate-binding protein